MVEIPYSQFIKASPHLFGRDVFNLRTDGVHDEFIQHLQGGGNRVLMLAPRGSGKSKVAQMLIAHYVLNNPDDRVILVSQSHTKATIFMSGIKRALETSDIVREVWGDVKGDNWRDNSITLATRKSNHVEPNLMALGAGSSSCTGLHAEIIFLDDVTDFDVARSTVQSERLDTWFKTALFPVLQPGGRIVALGTRYSFDDLWGTLIDMDYNTKIFPAIRNGKALIPWLRPMEDEMRDGVITVGLNTMKRDMGSLLFSLQMMNNTALLLENNIIKAAWIQYYTELPSKVSNILISVDPAISQKSDADFTCVGVWCTDVNNNTFLINIVNEHLTMHETIEQIKTFVTRYSADRVLVEDVGYQKSLIQELKRECLDAVIEGRTVTVDKRARLINVQNYFENGMVHFKNEHKNIIDQIIYFPAKNDDMVDMMTMAIGWYKEHSGAGDIIIF